MFRFRILALLALGVATPSILSCSVIFKPRDDVQRCGSATDCDAPADGRYDAECRFDDDNVDLDTTEVEKICVATFRQPSCDPDDGAATMNAYFLAHEAFASASRYGCDATPGVLGCPPDQDGACIDAGATVGDAGFCDDGTGMVHSIREGEDLEGQDARDQYCRSFFCDNNFVCDTGTFTCVPCDPDQAFGQGGCGELYIAGAPSCVYQSDADLANACDAPKNEGDINTPTFGCDPP